MGPEERGLGGAECMNEFWGTCGIDDARRMEGFLLFFFPLSHAMRLNRSTALSRPIHNLDPSIASLSGSQSRIKACTSLSVAGRRKGVVGDFVPR